VSLQGKRALVTGGSRGIGRGIALKLAESGARVAVHYYQNEGAARDTLAQVRERGSDGIVVRADVSKPDEVRGLIESVGRELGGLDVFVANARPELATFYQPPLDITLESWRMAIDSQATAFLVGVQESTRLMRSGGRIVAVTYAPSARTGSWQPWVGMGAAKAALEALVRYFAVALSARGITVNAVSPGLTEDSVLNGLPDPVVAASREWHVGGWTPMGRMGTPADIGNTVALLCSEQAGWTTGQVIYADGGASLMDTAFPLAIQRG
jgi:NAD(P)-dependent dehydrogenase (short-subunit alcohol dehydrogenase family)